MLYLYPVATISRHITVAQIIINHSTVSTWETCNCLQCTINHETNKLWMHEHSVGATGGTDYFWCPAARFTNPNGLCYSMPIHKHNTASSSHEHTSSECAFCYYNHTHKWLTQDNIMESYNWAVAGGYWYRCISHMNGLFFKRIDSAGLLGSGFGALLHHHSFQTGPGEGGGTRARDESVKEHDYFNTESTSALMKSSGIGGAG